MSLNVYDRWQLEDGEIPVPYEPLTPVYFDKNIKLPDTDLVRDILKSIDNAEYLTETEFQGSLPPINKASIDFLSDGCKTVLCIALDNSKCFNTMSAGPNAVFKALQLKSGNMIYIGAWYPYSRSVPCDILYRGRKFTDIVSFLKWRGRNGFDK